MQKFLRLIFILPLLFILLAFTDTAKEPVGKITFPLNRVFVIPAGSANLSYAHFNMEVYPGDKIETKRASRCEITLSNGDIVRIDENSIYTLEEIEIKEEVVKAQTNLSIGRLWANIKKLFSEDDYFKVKSPAAVIAVRGTIYRIDANADTTTQVVVYDGEVSVSAAGEQSGTATTGQQVTPPQEVGPPQEIAPPQEVSAEAWMQIVAAQQQLLVRSNGTYEQVSFNAEEDAKLDWVRWNQKRDALLGRR